MSVKININIIRAILIILLVITFWIIFSFSNQDGETSGSLSKKITEKITQNIQSIQKLEKNEKDKVLMQIEHFIRKLAHFSLYMVVGVLSMSLLSTYQITDIKRFYISLIIGIGYASLDEIHQYFISGRTASIGDVGIDSCGVVSGIVVILIVKGCIQKILNKIYIN